MSSTRPTRPAVAVCEVCGDRFLVPWQPGTVPRVCGATCHAERKARHKRADRDRRRREYRANLAAAVKANALGEETSRVLFGGGDDARKAAPAE